MTQSNCVRLFDGLPEAVLQYVYQKETGMFLDCTVEIIRKKEQKGQFEHCPINERYRG
jgi:hypothetical protein